jgi:hypothetical protein
MSSVPFDVMDRAIETIEQPRDRRRLYGNGLQLHACGSSGTTNEVVADLVLQSLHFLVAEEYEDGRPSSTLLIPLCQRARHINIWSDLRATV